MDSPLPGYWLLTQLRQIAIASKHDFGLHPSDTDRRRLEACTERLRQGYDCRVRHGEQGS